jgi:uncharacterized protein (DUF305 family)
MDGYGRSSSGVGMVLTTVLLQPYGPSGGAMMGNMDSMFIEQMIPHHDDAIAMAELALTKAEHPEIKRLAEDIKRNQTAENAQMRAWYRTWFGTEVPDSAGSSGMMGGMMGGGIGDLKDLETAESFDKAFIEAMIPHHRWLEAPPAAVSCEALRRRSSMRKARRSPRCNSGMTNGTDADSVGS